MHTLLFLRTYCHMVAQFVSFAAVITHSHLCLTIQAFTSNLSCRKDLVLQEFSFTGHLECHPLCLFKCISSDIESGLCFMSIFDVAMFSDVFHEINEKYDYFKCNFNTSVN